MTTATTTDTACRHEWAVGDAAYDEQRYCGAPSRWQTEQGEPRCEEHSDSCRRLGPVTGEEA
jgi:hypothetical protein